MQKRKDSPPSPGPDPVAETFRRMSATLDQNSKLMQSNLDAINRLKAGTLGDVRTFVTDIIRQDRVTVEVKCTFMKITDVDTVKQTFTSDMFVQAKWQEPIFAEFRQKQFPKFDPSIHWVPKLTILNAQSLDVDRKSFLLRNELGYKDPVVYLLWRFKGTFLETMELQHFPFDVQDLTIQVGSERPTSSVELIEDRHALSSVNIHSFVDSQAWSIYNHVECYHQKTTMEYASLKVHPIISFQARVRRKIGYFMWNVVLIMFIITCLTFTAVGIEPGNGDRIPVSIMLFLTAVAFKLVVKQDLPTISYLTYLDIYILSLLIFLTLQSVENACITALGRIIAINELTMWDHCVQVIMAVLLFIFHLGFMIYVQSTAMRRRRLLKQKDQEHERQKKYIEEHGKMMDNVGYSSSASTKKMHHKKHKWNYD